MFKIAFLFCGFFLLSCNLNLKSVDDGYYFENFDNLRAWFPQIRVSSESAHSGLYSAFIDSINEFSLTFQMDMRALAYNKYKRVKVSAWCYKSSIKTTAFLVTTVDSQEKQIIGKSIDLSTTLVNSNAWGKVEVSLEFPQNTPDGTTFKIFLFSLAKQKAFMDDLEVQFYR